MEPHAGVVVREPHEYIGGHGAVPRDAHRQARNGRLRHLAHVELSVIELAHHRACALQEPLASGVQSDVPSAPLEQRAP